MMLGGDIVKYDDAIHITAMDTYPENIIQSLHHLYGAYRDY